MYTNRGAPQTKIDERIKMTLTKTKKKFAFDVGWVFASMLIIFILHFFQNPIVARFLGPDGLGLFSMVTMLASIVSLVAGFGISGAIVKYVAEYKDDKNKLHALVSSGLITMTFLGMSSSIVFFILSDTLAGVFNMPSLSFLLKIYAPIFPFLLISEVIIGLFNGLREMKYYSFINTFQGVLTFSFILAFLFIGFGVEGALVGTMLAVIASMGISAIVMRKFIHFTISNYKKYTKKLTSFGSRLMGANSINLIQYQADSFLIGYFLTASDLGYYTTAVSLSRFFWRVPQSIQMITYPATSEYWSKDKRESLNKMIDKSMKYSACILLPVGLAVWFFAKDIVTFLFGDEFIYAVLPLQILLIGTVINGATSRPIGGSLAGAGRPDLDMIKVTVSAVVNVLLNILLIPHFGLIGAAVATTISLSLTSALSIFFIVKILNVKIDFKWFVKMFGTAFIALLVFVNLGRLNQLIVSCAILCVYMILILKLFLTKEDREMLKLLFSEILGFK